MVASKYEEIASALNLARLVAICFLSFKTLPTFGNTTTKNDTHSNLAEVDSLVQNEQFQEAEKKLIALARQNPDDPVPQAKLSEIMLTQKKFKNSFAISSRIIKKFPEYDWPILLNFYAALELKYYKVAGENIRKLESIKSDVNLNLLRGRLAKAQNQPEIAEKYFKIAQNDEKNNEEIKRIRVWNLKQIASKYMDRQEMAKAIKALQSIVESGSAEEKLDAYSLMSDIYINDKNFEEAEKSILKINFGKLSEDLLKKLVYVRLVLAGENLKSGQYKVALEWVNKAGKINETYEVKIQRANVLREMGRYPLAEAQYLDAKKMKETDPYLFEALAWNYTLWDKNFEAEKTIKRAIELAPKDPRFYVVYAKQLRDRRKLSFALMQLAKGKEICEKNGNCDRFDEVYQKDFFANTAVAGLSLDGLKIPFAISGESRYYSKISDIYSLSRGLQIQNIPENRFDLYLSPKTSPSLKNAMYVRSLSHNLPTFLFVLEQDQKVGQKSHDDPSISMVERHEKIESEMVLDIASNLQLTFFPYLKATQLVGDKTDNLLGSAGVSKSNEWSAGLRNLLSYKRFYPMIEGEISKSYLDSDGVKYDVIRGYIAMSYAPIEGILMKFGNAMYSKKIQSELLQIEKTLFGEIKLQRGERVEVLGALYESKSSDRTLGEGGYSANFASTKKSGWSGELALNPFNFMGFNNRYSVTKIYPNSHYGFVNYESEITLQKMFLARRSISPYEKYKFNYDAPVQLTVGRSTYVFKKTDEVKGSNSKFLEETRFNNYYVGLKLFW